MSHADATRILREPDFQPKGADEAMRAVQFHSVEVLDDLKRGLPYTSKRIPCASAIWPLQLIVLVWRRI